jgi:hypothetical protein
MGFLDDQLDEIKDKISGAFNPFEDKKNGLGGLLNSAIGSVVDTLDNVFDSVAGIFKPQFQSKQEAEDSLFNSQPEPVPRGTIYESSIQDIEEMRSPNDPLHIRNFVRQEFANREHDYGLYYTHGTNGEAIDGQLPENPMDYTGEIYRGPRTAWCRMTSNALYTDPKTGRKYEGFILNGVSGFEDTYGFNDTLREQSTSVLGYDVNGIPHVMEEPRFMHRPNPGIVGIESSLVDMLHNGRSTTVSFVCWSRAQLDYLEPYFFAPTMSVVLEWGWNNYPRDALLDLKVGTSKVSSGWSGLPSGDVDSYGLVALHSDPEYGSKVIESGRGNYHALIGKITKFEFSIRDDGGYDCTLDIKNIGGTAFDQTIKNGKVTCGNEVVTKKKKEETKQDLERKTYDFREFIDEEITSYLEGGLFTSQTYSGTDYFSDAEYLSGGKKEFTAGRYFIPDTTATKKDYEIGYSGSDYYITFGLFIDFVNDFFAREVYSSTGTTTDLFKFTCEDTRITAHPNIKSNDGSVLLIPNSTSPRRNDKTNTAIENNILSSDRGISSEELKNALIRSSGTNRVTSLADALKNFPRDDLYEILASTAISNGNVRKREAWSVNKKTGKSKRVIITEPAVKPFPDYAKGSSGYSGRLKDLYVNIEAIRASVNSSNTVKDFTLDILKKMSTSVGGIWDFSFTSEDKSSPNCPVTAIVDNNYGGPVSVAEIQREGQTYIFKSHQKNSIVKSLNLSLSLTGEVATEVLGNAGASDASKETRMFESQLAEDRLFSNVPENTRCRDANTARKNLKKADIEDPEKYIVRKVIDIPWALDKELLIEMADPQLQRVLSDMQDDQNPKNNVNFNGPVPGLEIEVQLLGIAGLRAMEMFQCTGIPTSYYERGHFRIKKITDSLASGEWTTTIIGYYHPNSAGGR